jgi:hypothetical protein
VNFTNAPAFRLNPYSYENDLAKYESISIKYPGRTTMSHSTVKRMKSKTVAEFRKAYAQNKLTMMAM